MVGVVVWLIAKRALLMVRRAEIALAAQPSTDYVLGARASACSPSIPKRVGEIRVLSAPRMSKCCCWRPGWLGPHHDDPCCEFLIEEQERAARIKAKLQKELAEAEKVKYMDRETKPTTAEERAQWSTEWRDGEDHCEDAGFGLRLLDDVKVLEQALEWFADANVDKALAGWWADTEEDRKHRSHGRGNKEEGPDDPDCPCRETDGQADCAAAGCGFCKFAEMICKTCKGRGGVGYIVGGISMDCSRPNAHEPKCPDCGGVGFIENV